MTQTSKQSIDFNDTFKKALHLLEDTHQNVFISGKAGTGKSTLLNYFKETTKKRIAVLAPTGVAAVNIKGQTIHSFFKFRPNITLSTIKKRSKKRRKLYQQIETIIIDEISMVRADLMDCIDQFLRLNGRSPSKPFGGIQMVFIGDLYQLSPVVSSAEKYVLERQYETPYFFSGKFFKSFPMELIELDHVYRQKDQRFVSILNAIRNNSVTDEDLAILNTRVDPEFKPPKEDLYISLFPTNNEANALNDIELNRLQGKPYTFHGRIEGDFEQGYLPTLMELQIKPGAQIMMVNNDSGNRWINGTIGQVLNIQKDEEGSPFIGVGLDTGEEVIVGKHTWELYQYAFEEDHIKSKVIGKFTQFPMKLAWGITIHKSQGKTFPHAIIDVGRSVFTSGQTYVALSRCTSLDGMVLKKPIEKKHIWSDYHIVNFLTTYQYAKSEERCSLAEKKKILTKAMKEEEPVEIVYLKADDTKTKRKILPLKVCTMSFNNKSFDGVEAYCYHQHDERVFRIDRILEIMEVQ